MDIDEPITAVVPSLDGPVLRVLARAGRSLTGSEVHRRAGRGSREGVRRVLHRLVAQGLVDAERHGRATVYALNRRHVAAHAVEALADLRGELLRRIAAAVEAWRPRPVLVAVFGSTARGDGDVDSDVDLLVVRDAGLAVDEGWQQGVDDLAAAVHDWSGNPASVLQLAPGELLAAAERGERVVAELARDAVVLLGPPVALLLHRPRDNEAAADRARVPEPVR